MTPIARNRARLDGVLELLFVDRKGLPAGLLRALEQVGGSLKGVGFRPWKQGLGLMSLRIAYDEPALPAILRRLGSVVGVAIRSFRPGAA